MAEQIGIVRDSEGNGLAQVVTDRRGSCSGCHESSSGCRSCLTSAKMVSSVNNPLGARTGDLVKITLPTKTLYKGAAVLYLLPIFGLIAGAFAGLWLASTLGWSDSTGSVVGGIIGLGAGLGGAVLMGRREKLIKELTPTITVILADTDGSLKQHGKPCCG
ncbi:MAG: SoxR reducing system RseC family protein [Desulfobacteraceae bacterium]